MKLFQIEEPEGGPSDPGAPGAAIGIDVTGATASVAFAVGGNAIVLDDRAGFELTLAVPSTVAAIAVWRELLEGARLRAERALARPATHAVVVLDAAPDPDFARRLTEAAGQAGIEILRFAGVADLSTANEPVLAAAILAEELAPRPESASFA